MVRRAFLVSHTHWDREWYRTFASFRVSLLQVVRGVLDALDEGLPHFCLDGQAIVLEDFLEIHPEERPRIERLVRSGALAVGPFYVLPDEFLVSAEALVRNLLYGHETAARFGAVQKVGYVPDSFGHVSQLPQILRLAGIDSFVYTRGNGDEIDELGLEYLWEAPDGSTVLALNQCGGYCNAGGLGHADLWHAHTRREIDPARAVEQVRKVLAATAERSNGEAGLLSNGCDHFPVQAGFESILEALREAFPGMEIRHASLAEYVDSVRESGVARKRHRGELRWGKLHPILSGVWSARMHLKQRNDEAQGLLEGCLEPLAAYCRFVLGLEYPAGLIDHAWKTLLANHPHDSICGCSIDEVHRDMLPRFREVVETSEEAVRERLRALAPTFARRPEDDRETTLCVFNGLPEARCEVVERLVVLQPFGIDPEDLRLLDGEGRPAPFEIAGTEYVERFWGVDYRTELFFERQQERFDVYRREFGARIRKHGAEREGADCFLRIRFLADLPPLGHALYRLVEAGATPAPGGVSVEADRIENESLRVQLYPDGTFDLTDKRSGAEFPGLNLLEDTEDVGDEYDYSPATETETITARGCEGVVRIADGGGLAGCLEARFDLDLPAAIVPGRDRRDAERIRCPVRVRVRLRSRQPLVDVETIFDNRVLDHRLRARFPTGVRTDGVVTDGHFHLQERPLRPPSGRGWVQPPATTQPQQDFTLASDGARGLAVLNRGLPEIEARPGVELCLTLLRCVGWLSRDDFATRNRQNAGPTLPTPDAQCPGEQRFRYAVAPLVGEEPALEAKAVSRRWRSPLPCLQGIADGAVPGGTGLLECRSLLAAVTAVKRHRVRDTLIVRLYNLTGRPIDERLTLGFDAAGAWRTDLLEEPGEELSVEERRSVPLTLGPHETVTVEVRPAEAAGPTDRNLQ